MNNRKQNLVLIISFILGTGVLAPPALISVNAFTVEEMLADPTLENRARHLSKQLRCLVCQNQSIDDSDADLAKDLRREVRSQLVAGKTDDAILSDLRAKYGDYVLLSPPIAQETMVLWLAPICFILIGIAIALSIRRHSTSSANYNISDSDRAQIDILKRDHRKTKKHNTT